MVDQYNSIVDKCKICPLAKTKMYRNFVDSPWVILYHHHVSVEDVIAVVNMVKKGGDIDVSVISDTLHVETNDDCEIACEMIVSFLLDEVKNLIVIGPIKQYDSLKSFGRTVSSWKSVLKLPPPTSANMSLVDEAIQSFKGAVRLAT